MKKLLILLLSLVMILALVSCDSQAAVSVPSTDETPDTTPDTTPDDTQKPSGEKHPATNPDDSWVGVATYNIVHCADQGDTDKAPHPDNIVNFIVDNKIAICGLQEVDINSARSAGWAKSEYYQDGSHQPSYIAKKVSEKTGEEYYWAFSPSLEGYHAPAHADKGISKYGNALISKYPILESRCVKVAVHDVDPDDPTTQVGNGYEQRSLLIATIDMDGVVVTVIVTHFGLNATERALAVEKLKAELAVIETPVIFMGDLNCKYDSPYIQDIQTVLKPTATGASPITMPGGSRIDYIFVSTDLVTKDLKTLELPHSDHYPVLVKVRKPEVTQE